MHHLTHHVLGRQTPLHLLHYQPAIDQLTLLKLALNFYPDVLTALIP